MKKIYLPLLLIFIIAASFVEQGCDVLNNLFLNVPLKQTIVISGSSTNPSSSAQFRLSDYDEFNDNIGSIQGIKYVSASYATVSYSPGLQGTNIMVTLRANSDGASIFSVLIPFVSADQYVNNPIEIELNDAQIALFNQYLADYDNSDSYTAELEVQNVSDDDGPPFSLTGKVEFIVELEIKP